MRNLSMALAALLMLLMGCQNQSGTTKSPITSIQMHRSGCYGTCPVYDMKVKRDGSVMFSGHKFVECVGKRMGRISTADFDVIVQKVNEIGFFDLRSNYQSESDGCKSVSTDSDTVDIVVSRGNSKKRVSYYYGCEGVPVADKIISLSEVIDEVTNTGRWVGDRELLDWMDNPQPKCPEDA